MYFFIFWLYSCMHFKHSQNGGPWFDVIVSGLEIKGYHQGCVFQYTLEVHASIKSYVFFQHLFQRENEKVWIFQTCSHLDCFVGSNIFTTLRNVVNGVEYRDCQYCQKCQELKNISEMWNWPNKWPIVYWKRRYLTRKITQICYISMSPVKYSR